ncbi:MAG: AAA family ATPase [Paludibacter sp.]|nr:AAA family ATPase [Paludibacter sp.]
MSKNKIKSINITGIRGVREGLNLSPDKKSLLIYGDNGTGKSSITDALEWFYNDSIEHLAGEEVGGKGKNALRNVFLKPSDEAKIEIQYSNKLLDNEKSINNSLKTFNSNSSKEFSNYFNQSQSENLFLRYRDLVQFIIATKGDKLKHLQNIIGFNQVQELRSLLKLVGGRIARGIKAGGYSNKRSAQQAILLESLGQNITSSKQFFETALKVITPLKVEKEIKSFKDVKTALKSIETNEETKVVELIVFHNKITDTLTDLEIEIDNIHTLYKDYYKSYIALRKDADKISKLQLLALLSEGLKVLKKDIVKDNFCPLCQQEKDKLKLAQELNQRVEDLQEIKAEQDKLNEECEELTKLLRNNYTVINALLKEKHLAEKENEDTKKKIEQIQNSIKNIGEDLKKDVFSTEPLKEFSLIKIDTKEIKGLIDNAKLKSKALADSIKGNIKLQIHTKLSRALDAYMAHKKLEREEDVLTKQQITFESLYTDFIKRQEEALEGFLTMFSDEINSYYVEMNPNEKVEDIQLVPIKDKNDELSGITIEYTFYNERQTPPVALLSESHINCLGLAFFLASVKAFNKENEFFVLDDVISSFDSTHRTRFIRLLINKFSDFQIILLTHEKDFFDIASSEAKRNNWLITSLSWTAEKGASFETPRIDLRTKIEDKFKAKNIDGLGNDIRHYAERQLKQIAYNIEAGLVFRFNDKNEERMMNELLSSVQSRVNKQSPADLKTKNNIDSILASPILIGNKTSHDNTFKENINDLEVFWEDVKKLIKTFYCSEDKCKSFVATKNFDNVNSKIRCNCGTVNYDWKK